MNDLEKKQYDQVIESVNFALRSLSQLFDVEGMHGMYDLVDPNLDQLKIIFTNMKTGVDRLANELESMVSSQNDMDAANASINVMNIKQGLLYAENLLIGISKLDNHACNSAHSQIKDYDLPPTNW